MESWRRNAARCCDTFSNSSAAVPPTEGFRHCEPARLATESSVLRHRQDDNEKRREAASAPMLSEAVATIPPSMTGRPRPSCLAPNSRYGFRGRCVARRRRRRLTRRLERYRKR